MKWPHLAKEPACADCGNEEDLAPFEGRLLCRPCLTCPHGRLYTDEGVFGSDGAYGLVCNLCFRELHTVQSMTGPRIVDLVQYVLHADGLGLDSNFLDGWSQFENDWLAGYDDSEEGTALYDRLRFRADVDTVIQEEARRPETGVGSKTPSRLLHHLMRRR